MIHRFDRLEREEFGGVRNRIEEVLADVVVIASHERVLVGDKLATALRFLCNDAFVSASTVGSEKRGEFEANAFEGCVRSERQDGPSASRARATHRFPSKAS